MKKDINIFCNCGCGDGFTFTFRVEPDDEFDYVYFSTFTSVFYSMSRSFLNTLRRRIEAAWFMLRGKEFYLHEVILTKEQWSDFVKSVNEVKLQ